MVDVPSVASQLTNGFRAHDNSQTSGEIDPHCQLFDVNPPQQRGRTKIRTPVLEHMVQDFRRKTIVHSHNNVEAKVTAIIS